MYGAKTATESHLAGHAWVKRRCEDAAVTHAACKNSHVRCDRVTLSERARQVESVSETGASHK